jgi:methionine biosynthesis protein MetW
MKVEEGLYQKIWENKASNEESRIDKGSRVDVALKLLDKGDRLLDIGCGDGILGYFAKNKYKDVYGLDISETALKIAKKKGLITKKTNFNAGKIPFGNDYFDAITCLDVIEHVFEPIELIKEIHRVLKEKGSLVISTPNIRYFPHLFSLAIKGKFPKTSNDKEHYDGGHLHYFTFNDVEELLVSYGFKIVGKYGIFGRKILKEFLSAGIIIKGEKL